MTDHRPVADESRGAEGIAAISYGHRTAFWGGVVCVTAGVVLHLPMYLGARRQHYRLADMSVDTPMIAGMILIVLGLAAVTYGLVKKPAGVGTGHLAGLRVRAMDEARIGPAHVGLLLVLAVAITIDVMKPTALGFVVPGFAKEYGLKSPNNPGGHSPAALLPLAGIAGTVIGSFVWGWLGDRIGRRASILLAGLLFVATAVCGTMPSYQLNLAMCFLMGLGVGGMLPITVALIAEAIPARQRGWLMVLIGGDVAGAYIITSWLSSTLVPAYSWRILWLIGLPTGLLLILLNRWIPESPRFLLAQGRKHEARAIMQRYGAEVVQEPDPDPGVQSSGQGRYAQLFQRPLLPLTTAILLLGLAVGLVSFGFQLWIPSNLQKLGFTEVTADRIVRDSALIGFPLNFAVAALYGLWSSRKTIFLLTALTAAALLGFVLAGNEVAHDRTLLYSLLVVPIWGISSVLAVLAAYSAEVYPTSVRSRGAGLAAGSSKAAGVLILAVVAAAVATPGIAATALIGAIPMALAAFAVLCFGVETRQRRLEEITAEELGAVPAG